MTETPTGIRSRKPTGRVPWPLILLEGPEKAGKSLIPVVLSRSDRFGMTYWIDLGEGAADEYAALPGADYEVIEHDGSYRDILEQVTAVFNEAHRAHAAGEPPVVLVIDSGSALWTMLVNWTNDRARRSKVGQRKLDEDPDAEIDPTANLWNDATARWYRVMNLLMAFPGVAIITARGKEVKLGADGKPLPGNRTEWKVEGQKNLGYDVTAWVRIQREPRTAELVGARSLRVSVPKNRPLPMPTTQVGEWDVCDLEAFIFDILGCTPETQARTITALRGDELEGVYTAVREAQTEKGLRAVWDAYVDRLSVDERPYVSAAVTARLEHLRAMGSDAAADMGGDDEPSLDQHGPESEAEKLRQAAEVERTVHEERGERDGGGDS